MKKCETLQELMEYIYRKHPEVKSGTSGFYGYKLLRKPDGNRILFETVDGFRIFNHNAGPDWLRLETMASGFEFRGRRQIRQSSQLSLTDLLVASVYDHSAEFYSLSSIDFAYVLKSKESEVTMLSAFVQEDTPPVRAQWQSPNEEIERLLEVISIGRKVKSVPKTRRMIEMDDTF